MKKYIRTTILIPGIASPLIAANGFLPINDSVSHVGGTDNSSTVWDSSQRTFQQNPPNNTDWGTGFQSLSFEATMLQGNGGGLSTPVTRTTEVFVTGGTFDVAFGATGGLEMDPLGQTMNPGISGTSISFFRHDYIMSSTVSSFTLENSYSVGWSPYDAGTFGIQVWEGLGNGATGAIATLQLFDENDAPIDMTNATWNGPTPTISADGFTATSGASQDIRITSLGDGDLTDDFIGRIIVKATPAVGSTFSDGTLFTHTTNGLTIANAPVVPEPSQIFLSLIGIASILVRRSR